MLTCQCRAATRVPYMARIWLYWRQIDTEVAKHRSRSRNRSRNRSRSRSKRRSRSMKRSRGCSQIM